MKVITLYQPYAQAIFLGLKEYETRPRQTHIRGRIAIHAGLRDPETLSWLPERKLQAVNEMLARRGALSAAELPRGVILGTVELVDCVPTEWVSGSISETERLFGDYSAGRWAWKLQDPVLFSSPIPAAGKQGWWNW